MFEGVGIGFEVCVDGFGDLPALGITKLQSFRADARDALGRP